MPTPFVALTSAPLAIAASTASSLSYAYDTRPCSSLSPSYQSHGGGARGARRVGVDLPPLDAEPAGDGSGIAPGVNKPPGVFTRGAKKPSTVGDDEMLATAGELTAVAPDGVPDDTLRAAAAAAAASAASDTGGDDRGDAAKADAASTGGTWRLCRARRALGGGPRPVGAGTVSAAASGTASAGHALRAGSVNTCEPLAGADVDRAIAGIGGGRSPEPTEPTDTGGEPSRGVAEPLNPAPGGGGGRTARGPAKEAESEWMPGPGRAVLAPPS
mmetsp:Transcript_3737/g.13814  ORF Transcript_3737/g.13814 Transcript_3737/m.13814 type:complete len:272 (-) Transcript_3737:935-1750(-)